MLNSIENKCVSYILFMQDVMKCRDLIGAQPFNKVIIVARSSQWRVYEFLESDIAQSFVNLLVIAKSDKLASPLEEMPYILYTHELYMDGLGSSAAQVLTSWKNGTLTRPKLNLFPRKMSQGFAGHRFIVALAHQPPYVIKRDTDGEGNMKWEGVEVRLIRLLAQKYNFTTDLREAHNTETLGIGKAVTQEVETRKADIGIGGLYVVAEKINKVDVSYGHSQDCAAFISLTSTALPRWRAIMGPFQWSVWLTLTLTYLFAIFPLSFSDRHSLRYLIETPEEAENMFWYVFGTFTNCFSFSGSKSWGKSEKITTRLLIGFYWIFTIIITACYTGSIIAFVTIPVFPETVDTVKQLLSGHYQIGTLDKGGWEYWFENSSDPYTTKLLRQVDYVPTVADGIKNITSAFFWSYAFLGSRAELDYVVRTNYTTTSKRAVLHISSECFVPFGVAVNFGINTVYTQVLDKGIIRAVESGFLKKIGSDVEWEMMRTATGKFLQVSLRFLQI
ncbi:ionotropic receptor 21a [Photinus pyralis]|uniref:ionotropic receptor 21a n=1 Tax=Photinus pyralis TaxID=7054 RepID=UPI0012677E12|nr:ionotropic receptor 21a [Photinus pyralis]